MKLPSTRPKYTKTFEVEKPSKETLRQEGCVRPPLRGATPLRVNPLRGVYEKAAENNTEKDSTVNSSGVKNSTTNSSTLLELKVHLKNLKSSERKQVLDYLLHLTKEEKDSKNERWRELDMWALAVTTAVVAKTKGRPMPAYQSAETKRKYAVSLEIVNTFIEDLGVHKIMTYDRKAVYDFLATLLVVHAQKLAVYLEIPLTDKFVVGLSTDLPGVFDHAFPGYTEAGMGMMVLEGLMQK